MQRRQFVLSTLGLSLAALVMEGCGSGKGTAPALGGAGLISSGGGTAGGGGTTGGSGGGTPVAGRGTGKVILPPGSPVVLHQSALSSGYGAAALQNDGTFTLDQFSGDAALLTLTNASGQPLLLGFSGSASAGFIGEVSSLQTAVALLFYALGAFTLPSDTQERVRVLLAQDGQVQALAATVSSILAANPLAIAQSDPTLFGAVIALRDFIFPPSRKAAIPDKSRKSRDAAAAIAPTLLLVNPSSEVNGLFAAPNADGLGLTVMNSRRRNALLYIYAAADTDQDGVRHTPIDHKVASGDVLFATSGTAGVVGSLVDVATGTVAYAPVTSNPYSLDLFPADAAQTEYTIDLIGNGNGADPQGVLQSNPAYPAAYIKISFITFAKDLLLPAIATLVGFQSSLTKDVTSGPIADASTNLIKSYDDLAGVLSGVLDLSVAISQTSARSAVITVIKTLANSGPFRQNFINWLTKYAADHGFAFTGQLGGALATSLNAIVSIVDKLLGAGDLGAVIADWGRSDSFTRFDAKVIAPKVKLNPATASLKRSDSVTLTASAAAAADAGNLTFHWTITSGAGTLINTSSGLSGASIDSSLPSIQYKSDDNAKDGDKAVVQVEAFLGGINDPNRRSIGTASSTITVTAQNKPYVIDTFQVDDNMTLWLNGVVIYADYDGAFAGFRGPFTLTGAKKGDTVRLQVRDYYGAYAGIYNDVVIERPDGTSKVWIKAFTLQTQPGNMAIVADETLTLD